MLTKLPNSLSTKKLILRDLLLGLNLDLEINMDIICLKMDLDEWDLDIREVRLQKVSEVRRVHIFPDSDQMPPDPMPFRKPVHSPKNCMVENNNISRKLKIGKLGCKIIKGK